jgi:hypothetical protein
MESIDAYQSLTDYLSGPHRNLCANDSFPMQIRTFDDREMHLTLGSYDTYREIRGLYGVNPGNEQPSLVGQRIYR